MPAGHDPAKIRREAARLLISLPQDWSLPLKKLFRGRVRLILLLAVLLAAATALTAALSGTAWGSRTVQAVLTLVSQRVFPR